MKIAAPRLGRDDLRRFLQVLDILEPYVLLWGRERIKNVEWGLLALRSLVNVLLERKEWLQTGEIDIH